MRGRRKAPGLRPHNRGSPLGHQVPFAFTTPLGLVRPMARTHVRLLGPCFKTGRRGHRPTRDRDASRASKGARSTSRLKYPPVAKTRDQGFKHKARNFTQPNVPRPAVRRVQYPRSAASDRANQDAASLADRPRQRPPDSRLESQGPTSRAPPFTDAQFDVLLNSLFKVLFNFPSRYLFAIGLGVIFSLTWSLPRTLSCTPKQLDSRGKPAQRISRLTGLSPSTGRGPSQGGLGLADASRGGFPKHHIPRDSQGAGGSVLGSARFIRHY